MFGPIQNLKRVKWISTEMESRMTLKHSKEALNSDQSPDGSLATRITNKRNDFTFREIKGDVQPLSPEEQMAWFLDTPLGSSSSGCCFD